MESKFAVVILAAGAAKRFGSNKLMASYKGKPLFLHTLEKVKSIEKVLRVVVTGTREVGDYARKEGFLLVANDFPEQGITRSLKLGLSRCLEECEANQWQLDGVLFCVCDQPELKVETITSILHMVDREVYREKSENKTDGTYRNIPCESIICAGTEERRGNPVFFGSAYFEELLKLSGDQGGKQIMKRYPEHVRIYPVSSLELFDVDTIRDLEKLKD